MTFYVFEVTTYNDGTKNAYGVYPYDSIEAATASFHTKMGGMMNRENVQTELLCIINEGGAMVRNELYSKPAPPTPDPDPEPVVEEQ